jgi:hypothetical protein
VAASSAPAGVSVPHSTIVPVSILWANSVAAVLIALIAVIGRRWQARPLGASSVPSRLAAAQGLLCLYLLVPASQMETPSATGTELALGGIALLLIAVLRATVRRSHVFDILLLMTCWLAFEIVREKAGLTATLGSAEVSVVARAEPGRTCKVDELPRPLAVATYSLTGGIGQQIRIPAVRAFGRGTRALWSGHLGIESWTCYLPFHRTLHADDIVLHVAGNTVDPTCGFAGDLHLAIDASWTGMSSCRDLERRVAAKLAGVLVEAVVEIALGRAVATPDTRAGR